MMRRLPRAFAALLLLPSLNFAQDAAPAENGPAPAPPGTADWARWERLGGAVFSPDGRWVAYTVSRGDGTSELRLRVIATDSTEVFEQGGRATFSKDGKWLAYSIGKSESEREALQKKGESPENDLGLFDLVKGESTEIEGVASFSFSEDGSFLALRRYAEKGDKHGADLVVHELATGIDNHFGRVGNFTWSEVGALLAMTVNAPDQAGNGVRLYDAVTGNMRTLESAEADFGRLEWREDAADLAVMREHTYEDDEDSTFAVLAWRGLDGKSPKHTEYDALEDESFPAELRVVDFAGLKWSDDGAALFFGLKEWEERPKELDEDAEEGDEEPEPSKDSKQGEGTKPAPNGKKEKPAKDDAKPEDTKPDDESDAKKDEDDEDDAEKDDKDKGDADKDKDKDDKDKPEEPRKTLRESLDEPPGVEVWHARDIDIVPLQKRRANGDERQNYLAALWLDGTKLVQLGDADTENVSLLEGQRWALGSDETPYEEEQRFSATLFDLYRIDVKTGEREKLLERVKYRLTGDPKGTRFLYVRDDNLWVFDLTTKATRNLTLDATTPFINQEMSSLTDEKPPYGIAGWTKKGDKVFLNSRYDLWSVALDGSKITRLTEGAEDALRHRRMTVDPDPDEERFIDPSRGFYVSLYGDTTKKSGFARWRQGSGLQTLLFEDCRLGRLSKADDADVFVFTRERFDDSPDLFIAGADLSGAKQVSETNAFADEYLWGHSELVDYESANGEPLQGALFYPAGYEEGKQYPMIVYIYELRSQVLHQYQSPSERNAYGTSNFTSQGYFVFQPDIVYRAQNPGLSAVECIVPAVRKVLTTGMVDADRVGLVGHSWGAYQTAFVVTQTDVFAAGVAGAPLTNMMSMSMSIYWNSGQTDAWIFHESQGRMDRPFWNDVDTYIANSPIFHIENLNTPLLMTFGDEDGAVDWHQGVEMYNAARLAQRPLVMLVYPGENHGLRKKPNQVDYHHRVSEWFAHYLKAEEAPSWITQGESWLDRKKALEDFEKKKKNGGKKKPATTRPRPQVEASAGGRRGGR